MTPDEYQWYVKLVQDRYYTLNLSFEQAEQVYQYEQDKNIHSDKHYFSDWEEWDFELSSFRNILQADQLKAYEEELQQRIAQYTTELIEDDESKLNEIKYQEELLKFYEEQFLPELRKELYFLTIVLRSDQAKIDYLKAEYSKFLRETKKGILITHFRYNRTFKPNELKSSLLRNQVLSLWPDYAYFKQQADEPTKAVATYLESKSYFYPEKMEELLQRKFKELGEFNEANFKKYHKDSGGGWTFIYKDKSSPEEQMRNNMMCWLLLEKNEEEKNPVSD